MKDIKEIMMEMDNIAEIQVAADLSEDEKEELKNLIHASTLGDPPPCGPCTDEVPYCCKVSIPKDFSANFTEKRLSVVSKLFCFVDPCPCDVTCTPSASCATTPITITLYPVRVIGCIQFIANASSLQGDCGVVNPTGLTPLSNATDKKTVTICCQGSLCVDQIVDFHKNAPTRDERKPRKIDCTNLQASIDVKLEDCNCGTPGDIKVVSFSGLFKLPKTCPTPTCAP